MNDKNRNLLVRIASSVVLLPTVVFLIIKGGWWTGALLAVAAAIVAGEYYTITLKKISVAGWVGVAGAFLLPLLPIYASLRSGNAVHATEHAGDICFWICAFYFFFAWTYHLLAGPLHEAPLLCAQLLTGMLYGGFGMTAVSELRVRGIHWVIVALVITWANDSMAYFAGRLFGKHKLYPEVSPNKTWEGFFGGMVGSVFGLFVYRAAPLHLWAVPHLTVIDCVLLGIAGGILGPIGDLAESMLKRAYGVKDSGKIIPGHGGLLDRIDALLFNSPMVFLYVHFVRRLLLEG